MTRTSVCRHRGDVRGYEWPRGRKWAHNTGWAGVLDRRRRERPHGADRGRSLRDALVEPRRAVLDMPDGECDEGLLEQQRDVARSSNRRRCGDTAPDWVERVRPESRRPCRRLHQCLLGRVRADWPLQGASRRWRTHHDARDRRRTGRGCHRRDEHLLERRNRRGSSHHLYRQAAARGAAIRSRSPPCRIRASSTSQSMRRVSIGCGRSSMAASSSRCRSRAGARRRSRAGSSTQSGWRWTGGTCTGRQLNLVALAVLAALAALFVASRNATTICVVECTAGVVTVKRGAIAEGILSDLGDVLRRPVVHHATIRISRSQGRAEVSVSGDVSDAQRQQLRNVVGRVPLGKLMTSRRSRR
jgi:hypothetical protein